MKLSNPLKQSAHLLKLRWYHKDGLDLRERLNVYGGMVLGLAAPILATRFLSFGFGFDENLNAEALKLVSSLYPGGLLSTPGLFVGAALGNHSAEALKENREERERSEKTLVQKVFNI